MSERSGIEIDYCPQCRGIWLDRGELDKILERSSQETAQNRAEWTERAQNVPPPTAFPQAPYQQQPSPYQQAPYPPRRDDDDYRHNQHHGGYYDKHGKRRKKKNFLEDLFDFD
jgi:Zn-finger nucleic acid-binding protein